MIKTIASFLFLFTAMAGVNAALAQQVDADDSAIIVAKESPVDDAESSQRILIEAKVFQIILNDEHRQGIDWEASISDYHQLMYYGSLDEEQRRRHRGELSFGTVNGEDFELLIEALDTVGIVNPLSSARVVTKPNGKAKIFLGLAEPYVLTMTTNLPDDLYGSDRPLLLNGRGVPFYFTPSIEFNDDIAIHIQPGNSLFIQKEHAQTLNIRVETGETIVIGGLVKHEKVERLRKIPLLGDLPILGFAFRNPNQAVQAIEYVIFLTPTLIDDENDI